MENVVDALKMAGSVLLFVIGLSVAILAFSQAREAIDSVLKYSDRESFTMQDEDVRKIFYYLSKDDTNRYIGMETIIPSIYRAVKENYKIVFEFADDYYLYTDNEGNEIKEINTENMSDPKEFIEGILYRNSNNDFNEIEFTRKFGILRLPTENLFNYLTTKQKTYKIQESLGVYIQGELQTSDENQSGDGNYTSDHVPNQNKYQKRIITYTFKLKD